MNHLHTYIIPNYPEIAIANHKKVKINPKNGLTNIDTYARLKSSHKWDITMRGGNSHGRCSEASCANGFEGLQPKRLVEALNANGVKINENTFSSKMNGKPFDTDLVDGICDILEIEVPAEKAEIFLA